MTQKITALSVLIAFFFSPLSYLHAEEVVQDGDDEGAATEQQTEESADNEDNEQKDKEGQEEKQKSDPEEDKPAEDDENNSDNDGTEEDIEEGDSSEDEKKVSTEDDDSESESTESENSETEEDSDTNKSDDDGQEESTTLSDTSKSEKDQDSNSDNSNESEETKEGEEDTESAEINSNSTPADESEEDQTTEEEGVDDSTEGEDGENGEAKDGASIQTGASTAATNILNIVNTNMVNSEGLIAFLNTLQNPDHSLVDLRDYIAHFTKDGECSKTCMEGALELYNSNQASVENSVSLDANSGENIANGDNANINTGNAYANANITNLVNTNMVDSNYLLFTFSSFGDWEGDVVLPSESFFENIFSIPHTNNTIVNNDNSANVENDVSADSDTGNNTAGEGGSVQTGSAQTNTSIFNYINQNMVGSGSFSMIFRVHGDWVGDIFSLPESVDYERTDDTLHFLFEGDGSATEGVISESITIETENDANVTNTVSLTALTGNNSATGSSSSIETGDAYANANITNIVNTNIVSRNWILAIVDVFGDWEGDVAFGRPDLWVGEQITADSGSTRNGDTLTYTYTLMNNGDTTATEVVLSDEFDSEHISFLDSSLEPSQVGNIIEWSIGSLEPGEVREITYTGEIKDLPYGETEITNVVSLSAHEPDENVDDNSDTATIIGERPRPSRGGSQFLNENYRQQNEQDIDIELSRTHNAPLLITEPRAVEHNITITNDSDSEASQATLRDTITAPDGSVVHTETFELGTIAPKEEITASYTLEIGDYMTGTYTHTATLTAHDAEGSEIAIEPSLARINMLRRFALDENDAAPTPTATTTPAPSGSTEPDIRTADVAFTPPASESPDSPTTLEDEPTTTALAMLFGTIPYSLLLGLILLILLGYETTRSKNYRR